MNGAAEASLDGVYRIGVVGAGPKALFALESLVRRLLAAGGEVPRVAVDVIDTNPYAGSAYAPEQPEYLRLNVSAGIVDAHEPGAAERFVPSFHQWAAEHAPQRDQESFPPRSTVGQYLHCAWNRVQEVCSDLQWNTVTARAVDLTAVGGDSAEPRWVVHTADGEQHGPYRQVLLATGHAPDHDGALKHTWSAEIPLVPQVYPVQQWLSQSKIPAGATVAVRGGALTFIDACLALTQGRGGVFTTGEDGHLRYIPSGQEPSRILPVTRCGLFLDAKSGPCVAVEDLDTVLDQARVRLAAQCTITEVINTVQHAAAEILDRCTRSTASDAVWEVSYTARNGAEPGSERLNRAVRVFTRSIEVAERRADPGAAWALGAAWSKLYPAVVQAVSFRDLNAGDWAQFRQMAVTMERLAFGPPLLNARKMAALIQAGVVDASWMRQGVGIAATGITGLDESEPRPDVVIDAVLPPPGVVGTDQPMYLNLLERGTLTVPPGRRGVMVTPSGQALNSSEQAVAGLSVIGRPTEDHVLGHDTLNRALHTMPQEWAQAVVEHITQRPGGTP